MAVIECPNGDGPQPVTGSSARTWQAGPESTRWHLGCGCTAEDEAL